MAKSARDSQAFVWCLVGASACLLVPVSVWLGSSSPLPIMGFVFAILSGVVQAGYFFALGRAYTGGDLSLVYPLSRSIPLILLPILGVLLLAERLSGLGVAGVGCVVLGIYVLQMQEFSLWRLVRPFLSLAQKAQVWAILTGLLTTAYTVLDKKGVLTGMHPLVYYNVTVLVALPVLAPNILGRGKAVVEEWKHGWWRIILSGILMPASYGLVLYVMKSDVVSYVLAVRQVSVVMGVIMGSVALGELYGGIRLLGGLIIFCGVVLIGLAR